MRPESRHLGLATCLSITAHAATLAIDFRIPDAAPLEKVAPLEVYLASASSRSPPHKPQVLARVSADGGGNATDARIERSADPLAQAQQRVAELEALQRQLLTQLEPAPAVEPLPPAPTFPLVPAGALDMERSAEVPAPYAIDAGSRLPRKAHVGLSATEYRFSEYVDEWRRKIERIGNLHYPPKARGKVYGSLRLSVSISADGSLAGLVLERSSGHPLLDRAAERFVRMGAPYPRFPADVGQDIDVLVITQTWHFEPGDRMLSN